MNDHNKPLGPAHNDPKQKLSYFNNPNHVESRNLEEEQHQDRSEEERDAIKNAPNLTEEEKDKL